MSIYPTANATQMADFQSIFAFVNGPLSGGFFMPFLILGIWAIAFIGTIAQGKNAYRSWIFANFICAVLSIILGLLGMMAPTYIYFFIILLGFGLVWAKLARRTLP